MKRLFLIALLCLLNSVSVYADEFSDTKALAEQGDAKAQFFLGNMYYNGEGVQQDKAEAAGWYRKAAEQGNAAAQYLLAAWYMKGNEGVPLDDAESVKWLRKAAEQGHALDQHTLVLVQHTLGMRYVMGRGVQTDNVEAVKWFRKAAEQGHAPAQYRLGLSYATGSGVPENQSEGYVWLSLASASDYESAIKFRDELGAYLSPQELRIAQKRATKLFEEIQQRK